MNADERKDGSAEKRPSGGPVHFDMPLPSDAKEEVVGSICATVLGAAESASEELGLGVPMSIEVQSDDGSLTIRVDSRGAAVMMERRRSDRGR
jgi:predicted regulator of Ras-like GTPase activity (Roadblock/LC7/MglB family)